jgi:HPt (histidine-containing phosphotransfer) domain-containing protein
MEQEEQKQTLSFFHRLQAAADTVSAVRITGIALEMETAAQNYRQELQMCLRELLTEFDNFTQTVGDQKTKFAKAAGDQKRAFV